MRTAQEIEIDDRVRPRQWVALAVVLTATFMGILDVFIVNVAAPSIQHGLGASFGQLQFVLAGYVLAYATALVTGGRIGDAIGRKRAFLAGTGAFTAASLACALAPDPAVLIAFRVAQGLAAAVMLPQVLSVIQVAFPEPERTRALGFYGATIGLASIAGQLVGGLLIDADVAGLGWRSVFLVNVPIGLLAVGCALPTVEESHGDRRGGYQGLDWTGMALLALAMIALMLPLVQRRSYWLLLGCPVLLAGFAAREHRLAARGGAPLVPLGLFGQRPFALGLVTVLLFYSGNAALFLTLAYYLQGGLGLSPLASGLTFLPLGIGFAATSVTVKRLVPRLGARVLALGALIMAAGLALVVGVLAVPAGRHAQPALLGPALLLAGAGQGMVAAPLIAIILERVGGDQAGAGSGVLLTVTQVANALGVTAVGALFATTLHATDYPTAFRTTTLVLILLALATLLASLQLRRR
jgi:MFS family permease